MGPLFGFEPGLIKDQQWLADQTGGTATFFEFAEQPLSMLDAATRFQYLLGYYPARDVGRRSISHHSSVGRAAESEGPVPAWLSGDAAG